ncbi:HTH_Tnp_Tc3_2 domain-containing protein [Trichonephila clavipes]|nr:HTH_Tnp_Tc3_2 domain-containing protein [Trichonephila clavipes]
MQHFPSQCVFGAPRTRLGAVKPPSCALPFLALVTYSSFVLVQPFSSSSLPLWGSDFRYWSPIIFSAILGISDLFRWHPSHLIFISSVKLFTSALKAFQCHNRIVMAQRQHLDDFLRGRNIGRLECRRTQLEVSEELGITQSVISRLW